MATGTAMGTDGESAGDTPRWRDLGDSRDLAAAVRSAYQSSPQNGENANAADLTRPAEGVDALSLLRAGPAPSRRMVAPRRVLAAAGGLALVVAAAVVPVAVLSRAPTSPSTTPMDAPTANPGVGTPTSAVTPGPWTYEPAPPTTVALETTTTAPAPATTAVARTATTTRARPSTATTRASSSPSAPADSPPTTDPPPANDEPTSGW